MDFSSRHARPRRSFAAIAAVALFHVVLVWLLVSGLGRKVVEVVHAPIEARIVAEVRPPPLPERLVPPPPKFQAPPPPYIPPPEVRIAAPPPPMPTITVQKETPPPPE